MKEPDALQQQNLEQQNIELQQHNLELQQENLQLVDACVHGVEDMAQAKQALLHTPHNLLCLPSPPPHCPTTRRLASNLAARHLTHCLAHCDTCASGELRGERLT